MIVKTYQFDLSPLSESEYEAFVEQVMPHQGRSTDEGRQRGQALTTAWFRHRLGLYLEPPSAIVRDVRKVSKSHDNREYEVTIDDGVMGYCHDSPLLKTRPAQEPTADAPLDRAFLKNVLLEMLRATTAMIKDGRLPATVPDIASIAAMLGLPMLSTKKPEASDALEVYRDLKVDVALIKAVDYSAEELFVMALPTARPIDSDPIDFINLKAVIGEPRISFDAIPSITQCQQLLLRPDRTPAKATIVFDAYMKRAK